MRSAHGATGRRAVRVAGAPLLVVAMVLAVATTAPPEVHPEPSSPVVRELPAQEQSVLASLVAASPQRAALVTGEADDRVAISFADRSGRVVASWSSTEKAAPTLVCTACPDPIVGDTRGYFRLVGGDWIAVDLGLPTITTADPLGTALFAATGRSVTLLLGADRRYRAVVDGGAALELRPTGLRPPEDDAVDFAGPPRTGMGAFGLADVGNGEWLTMEAPGRTIGNLGGEVTLRLAAPRGIVREARVEGPERVGRFAPCAGRGPGGQLAILVGRFPADSGAATSEMVPKVRLLWLDTDLTIISGVEFDGFYDNCVVGADGNATLWTGVSAGIAAVDVAVVGANAVVRSETVTVGENTLLNTVLDPMEPVPTLTAWPLGLRAVSIDQGLRVRPRDWFGGAQVLTDAGGGSWVSYLGVAVRLGGND